MRRAFGTTVLAVVVASSIPATAHHSNALYFDLSKAITLEGEVLRVEWRSSRIVGGGQIRFSNGDVLAIGGGPRF